ncbi:MAG TPA: hypothetical protein VM370_04995 [Candidatus Thermoplasmatota archaeon]|nr:hypothetical protein [Candidatus Thermoplasmatota archaeon]
MRRLLAVALASLLLPLAAADEPYQVVIDWQEGHFVAGTRVGIDGVDRWRVPFSLDACHREVLLDLLYSPQEAAIDVDGVGEAALLWEIRAEVWSADGATLQSAQRITASGHGRSLGTMPAEGAYELRVQLVTGAQVDWSARLRAHELPLDPACGGLA